MTSSTKTSADDHLTLLLAIGADTIGNVRVVPAGVDPVSPLPMFEPDRDTDFRAVFDRLIGSVAVDPVGLPGVQPKVSAAMLSAPTQTRSGPAILKLDPVQYPLLVENEHFFMRMAAACGLRVARTSLVHDADGRSALLVMRFDRERSTRIAQEDARQVADIYPASKYRIKTEMAITYLAEACARGGGSRVAAVLELMKLLSSRGLSAMATCTVRTCRYTTPTVCGNPPRHTTCYAPSLMCGGGIRWCSTCTVVRIASPASILSMPANASACGRGPRLA